MTDEQKLGFAYNEFIADFCERCGENQATRDEAHATADKMVAFGKSLGLAAKAAGMNSHDLDAMISAVDWEETDAAYIVALAAGITYA